MKPGDRKKLCLDVTCLRENLAWVSRAKPKPHFSELHHLVISDKLMKKVKSTNTVPIFIQNKTFPFADFFFKVQNSPCRDLQGKGRKEMLTFSLSFQPLNTLPFHNSCKKFTRNHSTTCLSWSVNTNFSCSIPKSLPQALGYIDLITPDLSC